LGRKVQVRGQGVICEGKGPEAEGRGEEVRRAHKNCGVKEKLGGPTGVGGRGGQKNRGAIDGKGKTTDSTFGKGGFKKNHVS